MPGAYDCRGDGDDDCVIKIGPNELHAEARPSMSTPLAKLSRPRPTAHAFLAAERAWSPAQFASYAATSISLHIPGSDGTRASASLASAAVSTLNVAREKERTTTTKEATSKMRSNVGGSNPGMGDVDGPDVAVSVDFGLFDERAVKVDSADGVTVSLLVNTGTSGAYTTETNRAAANTKNRINNIIFNMKKTNNLSQLCTKTLSLSQMSQISLPLSSRQVVQLYAPRCRREHGLLTISRSPAIGS